MRRLQPIVDANDVGKLLLALVFVLDGLGLAERERFNVRQTRLRDRVQDPFRAIIGGTCRRTTCTGRRP